MKSGGNSDYTAVDGRSRRPCPDPFEPSIDRETMAMQRLCQAIILQAVQDVKTLSRMADENARAEAIMFLERRGKWGMMFDTICLLAGWHPDDVHERYRKFIMAAPVDYSQLHKRKNRPRRKQIRRVKVRVVTAHHFVFTQTELFV